MTAAAEHVPHQIPDSYTRVTDLFSKIQCDDAGLQAAIAHIENDDAPGGKRHSFEDTVAYLLLKDPVAKRAITSGSKRGNATISGVQSEASIVGAKPGIGVTGVHLRYYTNKEYAKLTNEQRTELREYQDKHPEEFKSPSKKQKNKRDKRKKAFAAAVEKAVNKHLGDRNQTTAGSDAKGQFSTVEQKAQSLLQSIVGSGDKDGNASSVEIMDTEAASTSEQPQAAEEAVTDKPAMEKRVTFERTARRAVTRRAVSRRYL